MSVAPARVRFPGGTRILIPKILRDKVVKLQHEGHQGEVKTKY